MLQMNKDSMFVVPVSGMTPILAAELFVKRSPRELLPGELKLEVMWTCIILTNIASLASLTPIIREETLVELLCKHSLEPKSY
jgi:hypothetical protein